MNGFELMAVPNMTNQSQRPFNLGKVFYVDTYGPEASVNAEGTDPNRPLTTILAALDKCLADQNDYIMVLDCYDADSEPIVINKTRTHIIGINTGPMSQYCVLVPGGDTAVFQIPSAGAHCEIAGFNIGAGANRGGIQFQGSPHSVWIHHNIFGHEFPGPETPKYGIEADTSPTGVVHSVFEDNVFYGTTGTGFGKIDSMGMILYGTKGCVVRRNTILGVPGSAMQITDALGMAILDNKIAMGADTAGYGIKLLGCVGCWIDGNHIAFGETDPSNGYSDDGTNVNNWGINWKGDKVSYTT